MTAVELSLRKELAVTRMRVARAELALAQTRRPSQLATVSAAVDLASSLLEGRNYGKWSVYAKYFLRVAHLVLGMRRGLVEAGHYGTVRR